MILVVGSSIKDILDSIFNEISYVERGSIMYFTTNMNDKKICRDLYLKNTGNIQNKIDSIIFNKILLGKKKTITITEITASNSKNLDTNAFVYIKCFFLTNNLISKINEYKNSISKIIVSRTKYKSSSLDFDKIQILCNHDTLKESQ